METHGGSVRSKIYMNSGSLAGLRGNTRSAKHEREVRCAVGSRVDVFNDPDHVLEKSRNSISRHGRDVKVTENEEAEEDGVNGGRMRPLASFDVNLPSPRRWFSFRDSSAAAEGLPSKLGRVKPIRRPPRDKMTSSSASKQMISEDCKENNYSHCGLVPLCPGKTDIGGIKPKNSSPKASDHSGMSSFFGKKRTQLRRRASEIENQVPNAPGSTYHCQSRTGMEMLLMAVDSGLVDKEEVQHSHQQFSRLLSCSEVMKPESKGERVHCSAGEVRESRIETFAGGIRLTASDSAKKLSVAERDCDHNQRGAEDQDSEKTPDDPIISARNIRIETLGLRTSSPVKRVHSEEDSTTHSDPISPARGHKSKKASLALTMKRHINDSEETCGDEAERCNSFKEKVTIEPVELVAAVMNVHESSRRKFYTGLARFQNDGSFGYSVEKRRESNSTGLQELASQALNLNSDGLMENTIMRQDQRSNKSSNSSRVFHEPSLYIAHDIPPSLIQPVKIVGRFSLGRTGILDKRIDNSPMELDVGATELIGVSQPRERKRKHSVSPFYKWKKRKSREHVSALPSVRNDPSMGINRDRPYIPPLAISNGSGSAFRRFEDPAQCQEHDAVEVRIQNIDVRGAAWWNGAKDFSTQGQAVPDHRMLNPSRDFNPCQNIDSGSAYVLRPGQWTHQENAELSLGPSSRKRTQESNPGHLNHKKVDEALTAEEVTIAQFEEPLDTVQDVVKRVKVADDQQKLSSTVSHALHPDTHLSWIRNPKADPLVASFHMNDSAAAKTSASFCRRPRRVPLVASRFQDSERSKSLLVAETGQSLGQGALPISVHNASTAGGKDKLVPDRRTGPRRLKVIRPKTKGLSHSLETYQHLLDSNSLDCRTRIIHSSSAYSSLPGCCTQERTGMKGIRQKRGYKKAKQESLNRKRGTSMAGKYKRIAEPSGLLGEFNPGIMQRVRNSRQVHAILGTLVGVATSKVTRNSSLISTVVSEAVLEDASSCPQDVGSEAEPHSGALSANVGKDNVCSEDLEVDPDLVSTPGETTAGAEHQTEDKLPSRSVPEPSESFNHIQAGFNKKERTQLGLNNLSTSKVMQVENCDTTVDPNIERRSRSFIQNADPRTPEAAGLAAQWLELLILDFKGRLSALKRSRRRVRSLLVSGHLRIIEAPPNDHLRRGVESPPAEAQATKQTRMESEVEKWRALFTNMDGVLCMEAAKLESNLWQIQQMVVLCQEPKYSLASFLPAFPILPDFPGG